MSLQGGEKELRGELAKEVNRGNERSWIVFIVLKLKMWFSTHFQSQIRWRADLYWVLWKCTLRKYLVVLLARTPLLTGLYHKQSELTRTACSTQVRHWKDGGAKTPKRNLQQNLKPWILTAHGVGGVQCVYIQGIHILQDFTRAQA